jgi:hypothetical protein
MGIIKRTLSKRQKVYLALKQIGRLAHFSEIADAYLNLFPEDSASERSVHAVLCHEQLGVVWVGSKGKYALEEWGFKRPLLSIFDTVEKIVRDKYQETGEPVPFIIIQSEIGKYRKLINPNSVILATQCNPTLQSINEDHFIPVQRDSEGEANEDTVDQVLEKFDSTLGSS